jgi:tetratricopeptide (TPR) repeat protein
LDISYLHRPELITSFKGLSPDKKKKYIMKKIKLIAGLLFIFNIYTSYPQDTRIYLDPKYGADSTSRIECAANLSIMGEFMKLNQFDYTLPPWRKVFDECPASSRNIYLYGIKIYRSAIENEYDSVHLKGLIDTLMLIYDRRIRYFGQEGLVTGRKGIDLLKYRPDSIQEAYNCFHKSVSLSGKESEEPVLINYMQTTVHLFRNDEITNQELIDNYHVISDILNQRIGSGKAQAEDALVKVRTIFAESGASEIDGENLTFQGEFGDSTKAKDKALAAFNLAVLSAKNNDLATARKYALEAAGLSPHWGSPYILIGNLYASSSYICKEDELQQKSVFWIAVDQFIKAKTIDTSLTVEANELISRYTQYFPDAEDAFFWGISEGQEYTVGCWINEKTRVRIRKN